MESFKALRNEAIKIAEECGKMAVACNCEESITTLQKIQQALSNNKLVVVTVGEARTGKSSLLTSYLDEADLFPVDLDVTTCLVTMVAYGKKEKITVVLRDEDNKEQAVKIGRDQIADYAKEQNNPNGIKRATMILIETPNEVLKDGFVFVDTPGIGSLNPMHSQLTYSFLPRADLVLFVTDATSQISVSELNFLKNVSDTCKNILFVLTKKDLQYDCEELIAQNKKAILNGAGISIDQQIWIPVSSNLLMAYKQTGDQEYLDESNFSLLDNEITNMMTTRRPQVTILPRLLEISHELDVIGDSIDAQELACSGNADAIQQKEQELSELLREHQSLKDKLANLDYEIKSRVSDVETKLTDMLDTYSTETADYIDACIQKKEYVNNPSALKTEIIGRTEQKINSIQLYVSDAVDSIQNELEKIMGIDFSFVDPQIGISLDTGEKIKFKKNSKYQQVVQTGQDIRRNSFALDTVGGLLGAVAGGVAGFAAGGPAGAFFGASAGTEIGKGVGSIIGTGKGVADVIAHGTSYNADEVKKELKSYVASCLKNWNRSKQRFTSDAVCTIKNAIKQKINSDLTALNNDISILADSKKSTDTELKKNRKQVDTLRKNYNDLCVSLQALIERCGTPAIVQQRISDKQEY